MALQCANISGYTCNCASEKRGFLMRELQRCCVLSTLLTEKTLNKKSPVSSVLNVLQLKGLGVVVSSERLKRHRFHAGGTGIRTGTHTDQLVSTGDAESKLVESFR